MVTPVLKDLEIIDVSDGLKGTKLRCTAYIAEEDDLGSDCFYFQVVTSDYIINYLEKNQNILNCRATFVVQQFDLNVLKMEINYILRDCIRTTWGETAQAINRFLKWEYDNVELISETEIISD
ncbi:immunity 8 family protein [Paenibacillus polysaccharolyticus]